MIFWSILEIEPTSDVSIIKKAYAKKLRIYHPEEDPMGYQALREAYDAALRHAKLYAESAYEPDPIAFSEPMAEPTNGLTDGQNTIGTVRLDWDLLPVDEMSEMETANAAFLEQLAALYQDFSSRIDLEKWKLLLHNDVIWVLDNRQRISSLMLDFLAGHRYLPKEVWMLLNDNFNWYNEKAPLDSDRYFDDYHDYHDDGNDEYDDGYHDAYDREEIIGFIEKQIKQKNSYNYASLSSLPDADCDRYLALVEQAYQAYAENHLYNLEKIIEQAQKLFPDDPVLLLLEAKLNFRSQGLDYAIRLLNRVIEIAPDNQEAYFYCAAAFYETHQLEEALADYRRFLGRTPEKEELPLLLAKCYFKLEEYEKAADWAKKAMLESLTHNEARELLSQVLARLRAVLTAEVKKDPTNPELKQKLAALEKDILRSSKIKAPAKRQTTAGKLFKVLFTITKYILMVVLFVFLFALLFVSKLAIIVLLYYAIKLIRRKLPKRNGDG